MEVTQPDKQNQFMENVQLYIPLTIRPILDNLKRQKVFLLKWDTIDGPFHRWCATQPNHTKFTPFGNNENQIACKKNNSLVNCTNRYAPHTMFFCFQEEFDSRMKDILSQHNINDLDNEDIRYIKNMLLGYNNTNEQSASIIECNYTDLLRPCENKTILNDTCSTPPEQFTPKLTNIIANNEGYPFTAKGYTYNILGNDDKYGVTEVILPQGEQIRISSTKSMTEEDYFQKLIHSITNSSEEDN